MTLSRRNTRTAFCTLIGLLLFSVSTLTGAGQTGADFSAKFHRLSAYEVRPGILMTTTFSTDGQVCEAILQRYYSRNQTNGASTIPAKLEEQLIDEVAPAPERGPAHDKWLKNSFTSGGMIHIQRDFENVLVDIDGTYSCTEDPAKTEPDCGHGGSRIITIHWKKRACPGSGA
jgi:hypothetical protein